MITQELVQNIFDYIDDHLFHKNGDWAESYRHRYLAVRIDGIRYYSHRIIWLYHYGTVPKFLDHIDGNTVNNNIENLRESTMSQNIANADFGFGRGIEAHGKKYRARIWVDSKRIELGSFNTFEEAIEAYDNGAILHFGEYAYCMRP